jgi:hypothetical protein
MENALQNEPALAVEERYRAVLRDNRAATPPPAAHWTVRI